MIVIIDNYDSFTYNLVHLVARNLDDSAGLVVYRNDAVSVADVEALRPTGILISPGPGRPADAGITCELIEALGESVPVLGVCLGHQAIGEVFGGTIGYAPTLMHGKTSLIRHDGRTLFQDVQQDFVATRYHSLVVDRENLPACLEISATTPDDVIMGLRHESHPIEGIQFHPESLLTTEGPRLVANWVASLHVPT